MPAMTLPASSIWAVLKGRQNPVYNGERSQASALTRLFYDAMGKTAWQQKGFYSVLDAQGSQAVLMARMLELGHKKPLQPNAKLPDDIMLGLSRENMCPQPEEFDAYVGRTPKKACRWRSPG